MSGKGSAPRKQTKETKKKFDDGYKNIKWGTIKTKYQ